MDYLQYPQLWKEAMQDLEVLNLIINGLPSILSKFIILKTGRSEF